MIDLHCHLLPGIDDGAADMEDALAMARIAVADGITHAVMTPHLHSERYDNTWASIRQATDAFRKRLAEEGIALGISPGAEVRLSEFIPSWLNNNELPFIGHWEGKPVVLLELPHDRVPPGSEKLTEYLLKCDVVPMIAHPERNRDVMRQLSAILPFAQQGCLMQVTASSVSARFGREPHRVALSLLERDWVTVIATDAHNLVSRRPEMEPGQRALGELFGEEIARRLSLENPAKICGIAL